MPMSIRCDAEIRPGTMNFYAAGGERDRLCLPGDRMNDGGETVEFWYGLSLWVHFVSLGLGGAATFGLPVLGAAMAGAAPETRPQLMKVGIALSKLGATAIALLLASGATLIWSGSMDVAALPGWFRVKMVLFVVLIGLVVLATGNRRRMQAGDATAAARAPKLGMAALATFLLIVASAVLTFG